MISVYVGIQGAKCPKAGPKRRISRIDVTIVELAATESLRHGEDIIAKPKVQRKIRQNPPIVLRVCAYWTNPAPQTAPGATS